MAIKKEFFGTKEGKELSKFWIENNNGIKACVTDMGANLLNLIVPDKNGATFGFRIPDHPFILDLLKQYNGALASTSANLSGEPPALDLPTALRTIDGAPAGAVDGGALPADSIPSTIIQVSDENQVKIIRAGLISEQKIHSALQQ